MRYIILPTVLLTAIWAQAQSSCATALLLTPGIHVLPALPGPGAPFGCNENNIQGAGAAWYRYASGAPTGVRITTHVPGYPDVNTRISIGFGTCTGMGCIAGDDDSGPNGTSDVTFFAEEGTTYYIKFDCHQSACSFAFQLSEFDPLAAPVDVIGFQGTMVGSAQPIRGIVDMTGDGLDDVVTPGMNALNIAFQQPGGGFTNTSFPHSMIVEPAGSSMAAGDIDNNGHNDLLYAGAQNSVHVLLANGEASAYAAQPVSLGGTIFRNNLVDINSDGHLDGFLTNEPGANLLLMNNGSGTLGYDDQYLGATCGHKGSIWTDVDNDGDMDLFLTRAGCGNADQLLHNDGDLSFTDIAAGVTLGHNHRGQAVPGATSTTMATWMPSSAPVAAQRPAFSASSCATTATAPSPMW